MQPAERPPRALARRLRELRVRQWPGRRLTQHEVALALGGEQGLSESLISSWESTRGDIEPPEHRLKAYATLFATERSYVDGQLRILADSELTDVERGRRDDLLKEFSNLRQPEPSPATEGPVRLRLASSDYMIGGGSWYFEDTRPVTIVCARLPEYMLNRMPYADPADPDYVRSSTYADLDAVIELHGHIRAVNPTSHVSVRAADDLGEDDLTAHLVLLGGVDWNLVTQDITMRLEFPVHQTTRDDDAHDAFFATGDGAHRREFRPVIETDGARRTLIEDVGHFYRGLNPYNSKRTVTICNGMYGRGTYGVVRALTDARFRGRNEEYLHRRFGDRTTYSILARVLIVKGEPVTPDWTVAENRLHEWPSEAENID